MEGTKHNDRYILGKRQTAEKFCRGGSAVGLYIQDNTRMKGQGKMSAEKTVILLNQNWIFRRGEGAEQTEAETVCLPHTVQLTPANASGCRNYQGFYCYRKSLAVPQEYRGKKLFLRFEGAMGAAVLFVNGREVDRHYCGYTPFVTDITEYVNYGSENELYITLDNSDDPLFPPGKPQSELDFTYDGGLYRDVTLTVCEPLYITDPVLADEKAGGGIFVWYTDVSADSADVHIRAHIKNEYTMEKEYTAVFSLLSPGGEKAGGGPNSGPAFKQGKRIY